MMNFLKLTGLWVGYVLFLKQRSHGSDRGSFRAFSAALLVFWIAFSAGCASTPASSEKEAGIATAEILARLEAAGEGTVETVADFPRVTATTRMLSERIEAESLQQEEGSSFSRYGGRVAGYPALLRLKNEDDIPAAVSRIDIRRRNPDSFGRYDPFLGTEPLVLQPGESWEGAFIVSRRTGWFRIEAGPASPEGWDPVHGRALPRVFFRGAVGNDRQLAVTFWNLGEEETVFQYWIANGEPEGIPDDPAAAGTIRLASGGRTTVSADLRNRNWALVTRAGDGK